MQHIDIKLTSVIIILFSFEFLICQQISDSLQYSFTSLPANRIFSNFDKQLNTYFLNTGFDFTGSHSGFQFKANQNFLALQAQLEGSENRITVERKRFNEAVQGYNSYIKRFPQTMIAGIFGFGEKAYFKAEAGAEKAPTVNFK